MERSRHRPSATQPWRSAIELSAAAVGREVVSSAAAGRTGGEDVAPLEDEKRTRRTVGFKFKCRCVFFNRSADVLGEVKTREMKGFSRRETADECVVGCFFFRNVVGVLIVSKYQDTY
jgi:hypothetical protein